jgi:hypothetical protein
MLDSAVVGSHSTYLPDAASCLTEHLSCHISMDPHNRRYDLATEFVEALDHAQDAAKNTKILLRSPAVDLAAA